jgi:hypothetical protein
MRFASDAGLTGIAIFRDDILANRDIEVTIIKDQYRRGAAKLQA